jgi:hypothetical protein
MFIGQATASTIINCYHNMLIVKATDVNKVPNNNGHYENTYNDFAYNGNT